MAYALVGSVGTVVALGASVTPSFAQATTAGNLLICWAQANSGTDTTTSSSGWSRAVGGPVAGPRAAVFYKPNCSSGETAPTITFPGGGGVAALAEFSGAATVTPLDQTGVGQAFGSPVVPVCPAADAAAGELVVAAANLIHSAAVVPTTSMTFNNGATAAGNLNNDATSTANHYRFAYGITTGKAAADQVSVADGGMNIAELDAVIASFLLPGAAAAPIPDVGMALTVT